MPLTANNSDGLHQEYLASKLGTEHNLAQIEKEYRKMLPFVRYNYLPRLKHLPSNAKILDVGSGLGHFLFCLKELGFSDVEGLDLAPDCAEFCRVRGFKVRVGEITEHFRTTSETYDVVIMNDIIEHLKKDTIIETLRLIRGRLNKNGLLLIKTFNAGNCITGLDARYVDFTHEVGFTEGSLRQVLIIAGYEPSKFVVVPSRLYVYYTNPLNYVGWFLLALSNLFFRCYFILNGKLSTKIFSKNILAFARV